MILAEALSLRKDLQTRIEQIKSRLVSNIRVQEGDTPAEDADELMKELDGCLKQLETLIHRINVTNLATRGDDGRTITAMMAQKEVLTKRLDVLRTVFNTATQNQDRYSRSEIKMVTLIDVKALSKEIDRRSKQLRELDITIQALNFGTQLAED